MANIAYILGARLFCQIVYIALNLQNAAGQRNLKTFELIAPEFPDNPLDPEGPDTKGQVVFTGPTTSKGAVFKFSHFTRAEISSTQKKVILPLSTILGECFVKKIN
ncbi:MAG: hypothetical protein N2654_00615 [Deltaproteobacteria bacterium]|nr:hypothetical protein [Deltaproteobacteria bacterium]